MKKIDFIFILICLFVLRIVINGCSFADAACLLSLLAYKFGNQYIVIKKVSNDVITQIDKDKEVHQKQIQILADELNKVRNSTDGLKSAINLGFKK